MNIDPPPPVGAERALIDDDTRLQQVLDHTSALAFAKDTRGRYLFVNREFERLTGRSGAEILGRTDEEVFTPEFATRFRYNDLRVLQERRAIEFEEVVNFGSATRIFLSSKFPLLDAEGVPYAVCGIATDITERKRLEDALSAAALAVSQSEDETLYRELARYLATILGVDGAFIATLEDCAAGALRMRAFCLDGEVLENFAYPQAGTPCETVVGHGFRFYGSNLGELFPRDEDFRKLGLQGYAGHPINDPQGRPLGLISVISRQPLQNPTFVESVLRIFAVRVNAELARVASAQALRSSETSYRQIFEASEDSIFVHDWDTGAIVDVNPRACETYGYTREELLGLSVRELSQGEPPYTEVEALRFIEQAKRAGSVSFEWRRRNKDGSLHWDEVRLKRAEIGGLPRVLAFTRDITDRKRAEEALRASEEQYRAIFNASADALMLWNSRIQRVDVNPAHGKIFGFAREDVVGRGFEGLPYPDEYARPRIEMVKRALAGEAVQAEMEALRKDGRKIITELRTIPFVHRGEPHVLQIARDVTESRRTEARLRASEEQYRTIFNASIDALILWDSQYRRVDVNTAYERIYGWTREEVLGHGYEHLPHSEDYAGPRRELVRRALAGEACHAELESIRKDGQHIVTEVHAIPFLHRGEPHVLAIARDITERKRAEEALRASERRLRQAQKMEAIGQLTGGIAHDFNNLLTSIMGYLALASERDAALDDPRLGAYLAQAQRSCERARDLIQQMLMFSRGQRGSPRAVALASVLREALPTLRAGLPDTLELVVDASRPAPSVHVDPAQVEQVLLNLCINARDAQGGRGRVRVGVRALDGTGLVCTGCRAPLDGAFVELSVQDEGEGMSTEVMEHIFEPFFSTKEAGKGSGMGLAMVHGIVHEHGGHVVVASSPGHGANFRVLWPAVRADRAAPALQRERVREERAQRPSLQGSVLVVDDEETVGEFMRELLGTWGLQAVFVSRPEAALELFAAAPARFDVVITDQSMPRITGLELARRLRQLRADLPLILYTGFGDGLSADELGSAQPCAVIHKPVDPALLAAALARCLANTHGD